MKDLAQTMSDTLSNLEMQVGPLPIRRRAPLVADLKVARSILEQGNFWDAQTLIDLLSERVFLAIQEPPAPVRTYLGDGLYAQIDSFQVALIAPRAEGEHHVFLEEDTLDAFFRYLERERNVRITVTPLAPLESAPGACL